jgi:6-phosphogluconolactonase
MTLIYTGTYTEPPLGRAQGIGIYRYDDATGALEQAGVATGVVNPSFLAASADGTRLYAACEAGGGAVAAFSRDAGSGTLTLLNQQPSGGDSPCYVSIDPTGRFVLVANYGSGSLAVLPIAADGSLEAPSCVIQHEGASVNPDRQEGPHAHMILPTPDGDWVLAVDLGTDEVITYALDTDAGQLERVSAMATEPGAGPRHVAFAPDARTVYVITELSNTVVACDYDRSTGRLTARQVVSTLPEGYDEETYCAHILVSADGRFVYGSNRGHDSIAVLAVDEAGDVSLAGLTSTEGSFPRHFALDPAGTRLLVANQKSDNLAVLARNPETGLLEKETVIDGIPSTVCLLFV